MAVVVVVVVVVHILILRHIFLFQFCNYRVQHRDESDKAQSTHVSVQCRGWCLLVHLEGSVDICQCPLCKRLKSF